MREPFSYEYSYSTQNFLEHDGSHHVNLRKYNHVFFCWQLLGQEFFGVQTVENVSISNFFFDFTFWCKITSEK